MLTRTLHSSDAMQVRQACMMRRVTTSPSQATVPSTLAMARYSPTGKPRARGQWIEGEWVGSPRMAACYNGARLSLVTRESRLMFERGTAFSV